MGFTGVSVCESSAGCRHSAGIVTCLEHIYRHHRGTIAVDCLLELQYRFGGKALKFQVAPKTGLRY